MLLDAGVHAASYKEYVRPTIIIQIQNPCSPTSEAGLNAKFRLQSPINEIARAIVLVEYIGVSGKMSLEDIQVTVQIVVTYAHSHSRFFAPVIAQRHTTHNAFLFECAIVLIDE